MKFNLTPTESQIIKLIKEQGFFIWIVGGAIRDSLLNRTPKDLDFCTDAIPSEIWEILTKNQIAVINDKTAYKHGIIRVANTDNNLIDIATLRKDISCDGRHANIEFTNQIEEDLARRDFAINAIAASIDQDGNVSELIDPFEGQDDIEDKLIYCVGEGDPKIRFVEDYLRMLRACRFTALGRDWHISLYDCMDIQELAPNINNVSKERIRDEILKSLSYPAPANFWRSMQRTGLLDVLFPEITSVIDCKQNKHHNYESVWDHMLRVLEVACTLTEDPLLRLAAFLHDIGKPNSKTIGDDGEAHFYSHEVESEKLTKKILERLKFSNKDIAYVCSLVRHHQWRFTNESKDSSIKRWLRDIGKDNWENHFTLRCADRGGNVIQQDMPILTNHMLKIHERISNIVQSNAVIDIADLAINGDDLIQLGYKPGPIFDKILEYCLQVALSDDKNNNKDFLIQKVIGRFSNE